MVCPTRCLPERGSPLDRSPNKILLSQHRHKLCMKQMSGNQHLNTILEVSSKCSQSLLTQLHHLFSSQPNGLPMANTSKCSKMLSLKEINIRKVTYGHYFQRLFFFLAHTLRLDLVTFHEKQYETKKNFFTKSLQCPDVASIEILLYLPPSSTDLKWKITANFTITNVQRINPKRLFLDSFV